MNQPLPATQNSEWGFFGTMAHHTDPDLAWPRAMTAIMAATGCADYEVRAFLDSRHGRQFADDVANGLTQGESLDTTIAEAIGRWMDWRINTQTARETGIPRSLPYLTGFVIHEGITALATD